MAEKLGTRRELQHLRAQVQALTTELAEARETLAAIQGGDIDALIINTPQGQRLFSLEGSEHSYRDLIERMDEGAVTLTAEGIISYCNRGFARLLKEPLEQLIGKPIRHYVTPAHQGVFDLLQNQSLSGNARGELELQAADGCGIPTHVGLALLEGRAVAMVVTDLTERKRAEHMLARERFSRAILNQSADAIVVCDAQGKLTFVNAAARRYAQLDPLETTLEIGSQVWGQAYDLNGSPLPHEQRPLVVALQGQTVTGREITLVRGSQPPQSILLSASPLRETDGSIIGAVATFTDITQHKIEQEQRRLQAIALEAAANGIAITDREGKIVWVNAAFVEMTGYSSQELVGQTHRLLKSGQHEEAFYQQLWETIRRGETWRGEIINRRKDGRTYVDEQTISPVRNGLGEIAFYVSIAQDISPRKAVERELAAAKRSAESAKEAAENANRAKDQFLAVLSHELRNPLTPVLAAANLLLADRRFDPTTQEMLEIIQRNAELEARLIDDLLDITRIARGKVELHCQPLMLCTILQHALEVCQPDIEAKKLHFSFQSTDAPYWVLGDAARLQQVFWNLLKNAVKFTPTHGWIRVQVRQEQDRRVLVEIQDNGVGIEPEALSRIFQPFEQGERGTTRQFGGLGLGLAISKVLVELHGGTVGSRSEGKGRGASFSVRLPLTFARSDEIRDDGISDGATMVGRLRILLVEDHEDTARVMGRLLRTQGHSVWHAGDLATAMKLASEETFDLLVSDLGLPDGSGLDLMRTLRGRGIGWPGIALSGYGQEQDRQQSREAGFAAHLTKPVNVEAVSETIRQVIDRRGG